MVDSLGGFWILLHIVYITSYIGWLLFLGTWLRKISPRSKRHYFVFLFAGIALIVFSAIEVAVPGITEVLEGVRWMIGIFILAALVFLTGFIGRNLRTIETGDEVDNNDYFSDILSLVFWPIGIWMFQPRINRLEQRLSMQASGIYDENNAATKLTFEPDSKMSPTMKRETINRLIGYGILIFVIGFVLGVHWFKWARFLIPVGSLITFLGVVYFFKETNLASEFRMNPKEDALTYFWNVIVLKFWTFIFLVMMIVMNLRLLAGDF